MRLWRQKAEGAVSTQPAGTDATEAKTRADAGESEVPLSSGTAVGAGLFNVTLTIPAEFAEEMAKEDKGADVGSASLPKAIHKVTGGNMAPDDALGKYLHFVGS